jgi:AcrR family transcriptional regulator
MTPARRSPESTARLRASLVEHARRIVVRDGAEQLTMRRLAAEAGCALGLPYKVFADRDDLVAALLREEFERLRAELEVWECSAGSGTLGGNLGRYAEILLDSPGAALAAALGHPGSVPVDEAAWDTGVVPALERAVARYLSAEQELGRVDAEVDPSAVAFLVAGAIHNLLVSGPLYPRRDQAGIAHALDAIAARLVAPSTREVET